MLVDKIWMSINQNINTFERYSREKSHRNVLFQVKNTERVWNSAHLFFLKNLHSADRCFNSMCRHGNFCTVKVFFNDPACLDSNIINSPRGVGHLLKRYIIFKWTAITVAQRYKRSHRKRCTDFRYVPSSTKIRVKVGTRGREFTSFIFTCYLCCFSKNIPFK